MRSIPENTEELVTLDQFIERTYEETVHDLIEEISEAVHRLSFLLDHANLPGIKCLRFFSVWFLCKGARIHFLPSPVSPLADDLRLNSLVFQWPEQILVELENSKLRLAAMREKSEGCLTTRSLSCHRGPHTPHPPPPSLPVNVFFIFFSGWWTLSSGCWRWTRTYRPSRRRR